MHSKSPKKVPSYRRHKASGQALVRIEGRDIYLGRYGTPASHAEYSRVIGEYLAHGALPPRKSQETTVTELVAAYWAHRKAGLASDAALAKVDKPALRRLRANYGHTSAREFGPRALRALQRTLVVDEGLSRQYVNSKLIPVIKRVFRWAATEELVPVEVYQKLALVPGLKRGEYEARETKKVRPVPDSVIEATLPLLPPVVRDMVIVQRRTGMRPGEVCGITWSEIDETKDIWVFRPEEHKNAHRGIERAIPIGPAAQTTLARYRYRHPDLMIFSPRDSEARRFESLREQRESPLSPSQRERDKRRAEASGERRRKPQDRYTSVSYARAIRRACERAGICVWQPNQLRHTAATEARRLGGLDAAWGLLGHEKPDTTLIYAEQRLDRAMRIAREVG